MTTTAGRTTKKYSGASAVAAFITQPIPALDELIVVPIHYRMCKRLAKERGIDQKDLPWKQIRKIIWYGAGARLVGNFSLGLVPGVGMFANAITAIALTEYLGKYVDDVLANPGVPPPEVTMDQMKALFARAKAKKTEPVPGIAGAEAVPEAPPVDEEAKSNLRAALKTVSMADVRSGRWFHKVLEHHAKNRKAAASKEYWDAKYPGLDVEERADRHTRAVARRASAAGALASVVASTGELLTFFTDGLAIPIGVPAMMLSMAAEGAYTTLLQLDLASDLASIYGVPFADDVNEMAVLFALTFGAEKKKKEDEDAHPPSEERKKSSLLTRLMDLEDTEIATHIGKKLLEEAIVRNIVPVVGVGISARWNHVATERFAQHVRKYVRYRRALTAACDKMRIADVANPEVFVRGAWLLASCDGEPTHEEMIAIARVLEQFPEAERQLPAFDVDDEEAWFARVANIPDAIDQRLIDLLSLVAAIDRTLAVPETRFLTRLGKVLNRPIEFKRIETLCAHLREGEDLPESFFITGLSMAPPVA